MNKKIILTESQYDKLTKFIVETKFDTIIKNVVKVGDIIKIDFKNSVGNFKVVDNINGQIQMDNIDSGSANINYRYFITATSLHGTELEVRRIHKIKEKDKLKDIKTWKVIPVKDIKNIEVVRNGNIIDKVDSPEGGAINKDEINTDFKDKVDNYLAIILNDIKTDTGLKLRLNTKEELLFCCQGRTQNEFTFELASKTKIKDLGEYTSFILNINGEVGSDNQDLFELNKNIIKTTDGGKTFSLLFNTTLGDKTTNTWINCIIELGQLPSCDSNSDVEDEPKNDEKLKIDGKKALELILSDPNLKKAFYSQPSFLNLFKAELTGKKAVGTGIVPVLDIVDRYMTKRLDNKLDAKFKQKEKIIFSPVKESSIPFLNSNSATERFILDPNKAYTGWVRNKQLGDTEIVIENAREGFKILIKDKTDVTDVFLCEVIKLVTIGKNIKEYPANDEIEIKVSRQSPGYEPIIKAKG